MQNFENAPISFGQVYPSSENAEPLSSPKRHCIPRTKLQPTREEAMFGLVLPDLIESLKYSGSVELPPSCSSAYPESFTLTCSSSPSLRSIAASKSSPVKSSASSSTVPLSRVKRLRFEESEPESDSAESKWVDNLPEFKTDMNAIALLPSFQARLDAFKDYLVKIGDSYRVWVMNVEFVLSAGPYAGNALHNSEFASDQSYCLQAYEFKNEERPLLTLYFSIDGGLAELAWMQAGRGPGLRGNDLLDLYRTLENALQFRRTLLLDDANLEHPALGTTKIPLRHYVPIASETGQGFYQAKADFRVVTCHGIRAPDDEHGQKYYLTQDASKYDQAVETIRMITLGNLWKCCKGYHPDYGNLLTRLSKSYLKARSQAEFAQFTVHDLTKAICERARLSAISKVAQQRALQDLAAWDDHFLSPVPIGSSKISAFERRYLSALNTIHETQLLETIRE